MLMDKTIAGKEQNNVTSAMNHAHADPPVATRTASLWLIRHGQTDWNHAGRYQGHTDVPLNETGQMQVAAMAAQLLEELQTRTLQGTVQAIYSSDLLRAYATAQAAASALAMPIIADQRLREINMGEWEGKYFADILRDQVDLRAARYRDPMHVAPAGGETMLDVARRLWQALDDYATRHTGDGPIIVVSHGMALATAICRVAGVSLNRCFERTPGNAEIVMIEWQQTVPGWEEKQEEIANT